MPAQLMNLASDPGWLKLGRYESDGNSATGWRSAIHGNDFFLDPSGNTDPVAELQATFSALSSPLAGDPDQHAQCRFPARVLWLKARVGDHSGFETKIKCPAFEAWTRSGNVSSLSVLFATGYLGNPASYYGHTLLKFNFKGELGQTRLMDVSVNFGAIVGKDDDPVTYIFKSISGGYDAGFSHINFYFHNHNYGDSELRDMWEYKLDLPKEAVDLIVAHSWEVLGKRYTYHFFRRNCAFRMAEIIEIADGVKIIPNSAPWLIPQALIEELGTAKFQGKPLLGEVTYFPSRQSRFYEKHQSLLPQEVDLLRELVEERESFDGQQFQALPLSSKQAVLDTLLDYYQFVGNPLDTASSKVKEEYRKTLAVRYQLAPGLPNKKLLEPISPHLGRPLGWVQTAWRHKSRGNLSTGDALSIRIRPAYYDVLDAGSGNVRNATLVMGDIQLDILNDRAYINRFDLLGVDSANPGLTGLAGDKGIAWKLHTGAEQARLACDDCLVARFQGDYGYGRRFSQSLFSAIYIGGALQSHWVDQGIGYARTSVNLILRHSDRSGLKLAYETRFPVGSELGSYSVTSAELRWAMDSRSDLRISYERDKARQLSVGLGMYW